MKKLTLAKEKERRVSFSPGKYLYSAFLIMCISAILMQTASAATVWEKASEIMKDVYSQILLISTIAAIVTASVALLMMNFSKSGKTVDESRAWLKRIIITWAILNGLGFIMSYASGVAEFLNLPVGGYEIRELIAPAGYALDVAAHTVAVRPQTEGTTSYTLTNLANPGLRIIKLDRATATPIEGIFFELWHDGQLYGEYTTNVAGEILLPNLPAGTYTAREKSTVAPYVLDTTAQWIAISAGQGYISKLIFLNDLKPGMYLIKLDTVTMQPLVNAKFKITNVGGTFENEYTTDQNGEVDLSGLEPGAYIVQEIVAPNGYLIDDSTRTIQLNPGENARFVFTNTRKPSLELVKYDPINNKYLGGATFRIAKIEDGSNYLDRITDVNGRIRVDDLDPGIYSVQEIAAPSGYILNDREYHVELFPGKTSQVVVENIKKPSLIVWKYDEQTATSLPDTEFSIAKKGGSIVHEGMTNSGGYIRLDNLDVGWYTITELAPPPGYLPGNPSTKDVYLEPGKTVEIKFDNLRCPTLTIVKLDSVTHDPIKNVRFNVKFTPEVNFTGGVIDLGNYSTDDDGRILLDNNLQAGWYRVTELEPAAGYIMKEPIIQEIFLRGGEDKTLTFENIPKSALVIRKIDSATGLPVNGATFEIRYLAGTSGSGGTLIKTAVTSVNGTNRGDKTTETGCLRRDRGEPSALLHRNRQGHHCAD